MSDYITKSTVKNDYGLTDSMLKELGEPDKIKPNPHYRSSAPMQLYLRERVEKWVAENAERIAKAVSRRKPKAEKPEVPVIQSILNNISTAPAYRQSQRQVGDKWSWSVYETESHSVIKTGWAASEEEARKICKDIIRDAMMDYRMPTTKRYTLPD